jgi:hypothetical protein
MTDPPGPGPNDDPKDGMRDGPKDDPFEKVTAAFADAGERLVEYADVWRSAIERNAAENYAADDLLVDLQTLWGMSVRDVTRVGTAFVETMAPLLGSDAFGSRQDGTNEDGGSTRST